MIENENKKTYFVLPKEDFGGKLNEKNKLNSLSGASWQYWTKTVITKSYPTNIQHKLRSQHGGQKPQELCTDLIIVFTKEGDILYLDPPYNSRQYASNFHVLESISVWDKHELKGKTGLRDYSHQKSDFSIKSKAEKALETLIKDTNVKYIALSYNNEGIIKRESIIDILSSKGKLKEYVMDYRRFRTERNHEKRKYKDVADRVTEHLFLVKVS